MVIDSGWTSKHLDVSIVTLEMPTDAGWTEMQTSFLTVIGSKLMEEGYTWTHCSVCCGLMSIWMLAGLINIHFVIFKYVEGIITLSVSVWMHLMAESPMLGICIDSG